MANSSPDISIMGDSNALFNIDLSSPLLTASSIIFKGHALNDSTPIIIKMDLLTLNSVCSSLPESHSCMPLYKAALLKIEESETTVDFDGQNATSIHEVQVHESILKYHRHNQEPLTSLCLALDTFAQQKGLIMARHRPLQPDTRSPRLSLVQVSRLARDMSAALTAIHDAGWVHCDVSVANVVIACTECDRDAACDDPCTHNSIRKYRLIDFGLCQQLDQIPSSPVTSIEDGSIPDACGTPGFVAPEVMALNHHHQSDDAMNFAWMLPSPDIHMSSSPHRLFRSSSYHSIADSAWTSSDIFTSTTPPRSNEFKYLVSPMDSSAYLSTTPVQNDATSPQLPPLPSKRWRSRILAARDIYSMGVVVGLALSGYLPLCDADHLGSIRSNADYVRDHIVPKLYAFRRIIKTRHSRSSIYANTLGLNPADLQGLKYALDFVLQCLIESPVLRPCAKTLLRRHPICTWANSIDEDEVRSSATTTVEEDLMTKTSRMHISPMPAWMTDPACFMRSPINDALRDAMEDCRHEWEHSEYDHYTSSTNGDEFELLEDLVEED